MRKIADYLRNALIRNWRTALPGAIVGALTVAYLLHKLSTEQFVTVSGALSALGLTAAKDAGTH